MQDTYFHEPAAERQRLRQNRSTGGTVPSVALRLGRGLRQRDEMRTWSNGTGVEVRLVTLNFPVILPLHHIY